MVEVVEVESWLREQLVMFNLLRWRMAGNCIGNKVVNRSRLIHISISLECLRWWDDGVIK